MSKLNDTLAQTWLNIQTSLFPWLSEELGELTAKQQELVTTLEMIRIEEFILSSKGYPGRLKWTPLSRPFSPNNKEKYLTFSYKMYFTWCFITQTLMQPFLVIKLKITL